MVNKTSIVITSKHRYRQLDSLRGLAALFVLLTHFSGLVPQSAFFDAIKASPFGVLFNGNAAVMFFFILSGFVLSLPFVDGTKPLKLTEFYIKRIFRIYPAFIVAIGFSLLLKQFVFDKYAMANFSVYPDYWNWDWSKESIKELIHTLMLIGPDFKINFIDPPIWSLVIEMKMSIILPFFIVIVSRNSMPLNLIFLFVITYLTYDHNAWAISVFYLGILMAKYKDGLFVMIKGWNVFVLTLVIALCILLYNNNFEFSNFIKQAQSPVKYIWSKYLMAIGGGMVIMIVLSRNRLSSFFSKSIFTFLGDISYSFYLIHAPLLWTITSLILNRFVFSTGCILVLTLIITITCSYMINVLVEKPFQQIAIALVKRFPSLNKITL